MPDGHGTKRNKQTKFKRILRVFAQRIQMGRADSHLSILDTLASTGKNVFSSNPFILKGLCQFFVSEMVDKKIKE